LIFHLLFYLARTTPSQFHFSPDTVSTPSLTPDPEMHSDYLFPRPAPFSFLLPSLSRYAQFFAGFFKSPTHRFDAQPPFVKSFLRFLDPPFETLNIFFSPSFLTRPSVSSYQLPRLAFAIRPYPILEVLVPYVPAAFFIQGRLPTLSFFVFCHFSFSSYTPLPPAMARTAWRFRLI